MHLLTIDPLNIKQCFLSYQSLVCLLSMDKNTETEVPTGRVHVPKVRTANVYCVTQRKCAVAEWVMRGNCGSYSVALSLLTLAVTSLLTAPWVH